MAALTPKYVSVTPPLDPPAAPLRGYTKKLNIKI